MALNSDWRALAVRRSRLVDHLAFRVAEPDDLKALERHAEQLGYPVESRWS